ncbi:MAG: hypothetical protein J3R72DRAFT_427591 [Linnemannia gamsii]|nr:MAG: hypothetical protein J3R72DRAFT_427591 [Linnemannia gamsii]
MPRQANLLICTLIIINGCCKTCSSMISLFLHQEILFKFWPLAAFHISLECLNQPRSPYSLETSRKGLFFGTIPTLFPFLYAHVVPEFALRWSLLQVNFDRPRPQ